MISEHSLINYFYRKWLVQVLLLSIFPTPTNTHGFIAETLVTTARGLVPIQRLQLQKTVLSAKLHHFVAYSPITAMTKLSTHELIGLEIGDTIIMMHPRQLLYSVARTRWVAAKDFTVSDTVLTADGEVLPISAILRRQSNAIVYAPTVAKHHTFFVSHYKILAHNAEIVITGCTLALIDAIAYTFAALVVAKQAGDFFEERRLARELQELREELEAASEESIDADEEECEDQEEDIADQKEAKTVDDILEGAERCRKIKNNRLKHFIKGGGFSQTFEDFESLKPTNVKDIECGKTGILPDGRKITARTRSDDGRPTLEIQEGAGEIPIKIRYNS